MWGCNIHTTRETWLIEAIEKLTPLVTETAGLKLPKKIKVSCGFPGQGSRKKRIGECWNKGGKEFVHIFISPVVHDEVAPQGVLSVLLHEMIHAALPPGTGHKGPFKQAAKVVGLESKATTTSAGVDLIVTFKRIVKEIGPYPHRALALSGGGEKKQTTRLLKVACPGCDYVARVTRTHLDEKGPPICPQCKISFEEA